MGDTSYEANCTLREERNRTVSIRRIDILTHMQLSLIGIILYIFICQYLYLQHRSFLTVKIAYLKPNKIPNSISFSTDNIASFSDTFTLFIVIARLTVLLCHYYSSMLMHATPAEARHDKHRFT